MARAIRFHPAAPAAVCLERAVIVQTPQSLLEKLRQQPDAAAWKRLVDLYTPLLQRWLRH